MTEEMLKKMDDFLKKEVMKCAEYYDKNVRGAYYRVEHSYRVAYIAKEIAIKENFDPDCAFIAGLFHDIGYSIDYSNKDANDHGRDGAKIVRPFLYSLGFSKKQVEEMCYGIAIHVDDKADFDHKPTTLALSIVDADNVDRLDAYRLYECLHTHNYMNLSIDEQRKFIDSQLDRLKKLKTMGGVTKTARKMLDEKINYQIEFFNRLKNQVEHSF